MSTETPDTTTVDLHVDVMCPLALIVDGEFVNIDDDKADSGA